jgi:hypothetical protein
MNFTVIFFVMITSLTLQLCNGLDFQFLKRDFYNIRKYLDEEILGILIIYESGNFEENEGIREFLTMSLQRNIFANELVVSEG